MRRGTPCCGNERIRCNPLAEKLQHLWDRTIGSIVRINDISPDGDGDFTIEAGENIRITEQGTGNGIRIDTTGGVSYYSAAEDSGITVDNTNLKIGTNGLAKQSDLETVADAALQNSEDIADILDGTKSATRATNADSAVNAQYLGSSSANIGSDTRPVKIVNGQAVEVSRDMADFTPYQVSIFSTSIGNTQQVTGRLCYIRTGHKKGVLSGCLKIASNSDRGVEVTSISKISQLIGIDFNIESGFTGSWMTNNTRIDFHGYGATINILSSGRVSFGRYYTLNDFGDWSLNDISDIYIMFQDVELTES